MMDTLTKYLAVAAGGAVGAILRYYLGGSILSRTANPFPTATFFINITGSFVIGFFLTFITEKIPIHPNVRLAIAVGFVGAYTTFSTFEYETAKLVEEKDFIVAILYIVLSVVFGFLAVTAGIIAARELRPAAGILAPMPKTATPDDVIDTQTVKTESERVMNNSKP